MEQYIDEFGNLQFRAVGTNNEFPFVNISQFADGINEGKSINQIIQENQIEKFTPKDTVTSLPNFQDNYYLPSSAVKSNVVTPQKFEAPYEIIGGEKVYLGDTLGKQAALEKANFYQEPTGILTQAKDFITQQLPKTLKSGLDTLVDFIPGMRFIRSLDKFDSLPYQDRKFIKSVMDMKGISGSGIYVDPNTGLIKDIRGKNVRSLRGNYAENIENDFNAKVESLDKSKSRWNEKYGDLNNVNEYGKTWEQMNKNNLNTFAFLTDMKAKLDQQKADLKEKIKRTKSINIHGDGSTSSNIKLGSNLTQDSSYKSDPALSALGRREYTGPGKAFEARNTGTGKGPK